MMASAHLPASCLCWCVCGVLRGVVTNKSFVLNLLSHPDFVKVGRRTT